jgi:hypothetical protein
MSKSLTTELKEDTSSKQKNKLDIICVFTANRKKFDKYVKVNRIANKVIIDVSKIISTEKLDLDDPIQMTYFRILIQKKLKGARDKNKIVYYIPHIKSERFSVKSLTSLSKLCGEDGKFGMLFFWADFPDKSPIRLDLIENIDSFSFCQMFEDY